MSFSQYYLIAGGFQGGDGEPISNGILKLQLYPNLYTTNLADPGIIGDAGTLCICGGQTIECQLDEDGNVITSPRQYIFPTNLLQSSLGGPTPTDSGLYYALTVEDENGQIVYGPNYYQINAVSGLFPIDVGALIPGNPTDLFYPTLPGYVVVQTAVLTGTVSIFKIPIAPNPLMMLFKNGAFLSPNNIDYQVSDSRVFLNVPATVNDVITSFIFFDPTFVPGLTQEDLSGSGVTFSLSQMPVTGSVMLFRNGLYQSAGVDYTISGSTITLGSALGGDDLFAVYSTSATFITTLQEVPSGAINSNNVQFTLSHLPAMNAVLIFLNGVFQTAGIDYFIPTDDPQLIIMTRAPMTGDNLRVAYQYSN